MSWFIAAWLAIQSSPAEAESLHSSAPQYLTHHTAVAHLGAARLAAYEFGVSPYDLLSIAFHESRYVVNLQTIEPGSRVSCGAMTPVPKSRCTADDLSLLGGYRAGARHLRQWINICHSLDKWRHDVDDEKIHTCALWAYAGGLSFRSYCETREEPRCDVVRQFLDRARQLKLNIESAR